MNRSFRIKHLMQILDVSQVCLVFHVFLWEFACFIVFRSHRELPIIISQYTIKKKTQFAVVSLQNKYRLTFWLFKESSLVINALAFSLVVLDICCKTCFNPLYQNVLVFCRNYISPVTLLGLCNLNDRPECRCLLVNAWLEETTSQIMCYSSQVLHCCQGNKQWEFAYKPQNVCVETIRQRWTFDTSLLTTQTLTPLIYCLLLSRLY